MGVGGWSPRRGGAGCRGGGIKGRSGWPLGRFFTGGRGRPRDGEWGSPQGPASPSAKASLHSKLISNRKGLWKGLGFSSTATFSTDTLAITSPGRGRGCSGARVCVRFERGRGGW